jgi:hypothetical protein
MEKLSKKRWEEIRNNISRVNWEHICYNYKLPEKFLIEFESEIDWSYAIVYQKLSENILRRFGNLSTHWWSLICMYQTLSEDFIREFQNEVMWHDISEKQTLSESFLIEHIDRIKIEHLKRNSKIPKEVKEKIIVMKELMV